MAAARIVTVTLARAWDAAEQAEQAEQAGLIQFAVALDHQGHPDPQAWLDDPEPWPARFGHRGEPPRQGDVAHDEDGWQLRCFIEGGSEADPLVHRLHNIAAGLRPGVVLTLRALDGAETAWRVVGVSAPVD